MNNEEIAILITIKQEPKYRFIGKEGKDAQSLVEKGILQSVGNKMFALTKKGEKEFEASKKKSSATP